MLKKIISIFKSSEAPKKKPTQTKSNSKPSGTSMEPKVQPTRIGELGEHKVNIQLDQPLKAVNI